MAVFPVAFQDGKDAVCSTSLNFLVEKAMEHCFDILGTGWFNANLSMESVNNDPVSGIQVSYGRRRKDMIHKSISGINPGAALLEHLAEYNPIEWHKDFKSGYRWPEDIWYRDIKPGAVSGADVKVTWELSRCYHSGPMGLYWQHTRKPGLAEEFQLQIIDWIVGNPLYYGVNWRNAMEAGLRAANWLLGVGFFRGKGDLTPEFIWMLQKSLYEHASFILHNIEKNSFGANNHYLGNLVGLIAIGASAPWISDSDDWTLFGIQELIQEMRRQVYSDGTHFEASTSYHRLVTEMFLASYMIIVSLPEKRRKRLNERLLFHGLPGRTFKSKPEYEFSFDHFEVFPDWFVERLRLMIGFIRDISRPDDELPQIGDNDSGRVFWLPVPFELINGVANWKLNAHEELIKVADRILVKGTEKNKKGLGAGSYDGCRKDKQIWKDAVLYPDFGIAVYRKGPIYLIISCGRNGGNGEGGHAHNDKLSFELAICGKDFIVDPGTYLYTSHPNERNYFRSTAAHNTVGFPDMEQNDIPANSLFRLSDRARAAIIHFDNDRFAGKHSGFNFVCQREFLVKEREVQINDASEKPGGLIMLNLHPEVTYKGGMLLRDDISVQLQCNGVSEVVVEPALYSPRYGVKMDSCRLVARRTGKVSNISFLL
ncbi:MAG: alginate lyase family protein [Thermodesulfobacteriota bacterium]|nr:alginate lyase family protein [Thermodesulfobacteriota bacterium]